MVIVSVGFMLLYMTLAAKLGAVTGRSPGDIIRERVGRPLAILLGLSVFFIVAAFQSGNNIGVAAAFEAFVDSPPVVVSLVVAFNIVALIFLFGFKDLYVMLERLMMTFVGLMLVSFAINLFLLRPDARAIAKGFVPSFAGLELPVLGLIGTTFVVAAAFYQAYLVQQKGWDVNEVRSGIIDARVGSVIMALITIMLISTAAAGLYTGQAVTLSDPVAVADALEPTFGSFGKAIFCVGLFSAAYSSFLVNSMIGGFILSDGLGLGSQPSDPWTRWLTALALLVGMLVALAAMTMGFDRTPTVVAAQAVTVVAAPLVAAVLFWMSGSKSIMGTHAAGTVTKVFAAIGLFLLLAIAARTAFVTLPAKIQEYRSRSSASVDGFGQFVTIGRVNIESCESKRSRHLQREGPEGPVSGIRSTIFLPLSANSRILSPNRI